MTSKQRAQLRAQAHDLKPAVHIGKEGVSEAALRGVQEAFNTRELLKVKVLDTAPGSARDIGEAIAGQLDGAEVIQVIGRIAVLYRPAPAKEQG